VSKETPKVASSYDKKEKKAMTSQKRRAEKKDPKVGKGNKPTMVSYKPRKNESLRELIKDVLKEHLSK
jgi:ribosomal protein L44E